MGGGLPRLCQQLLPSPSSEKRLNHRKMDNTNAADEDNLLQPANSEEEVTTSSGEIQVEEAVIIDQKQEEIIPDKGLENKEQDSNYITMATEEVKEAMEELLQETEEKSIENQKALPDSSETVKVNEVAMSDGEIVEEKLQGAESPLTTPEEESASPVTTVTAETGISTSEESSKGKEKVAEKNTQSKDEGKKEKPKEAKKPKKGRDSEHMSRAIVQALAGLNSSEEKIAALCKKYTELLGEHKSLQREHKTQQKQMATLQRDRDQLQSEHGRAILAKSKLESLCRELQRHNKTIKEESLQRAKDEEEKRKEVSAKFQQTINEITNQMQENHNRNIRLKEENLELASKLKKLVEQYERREEHIDKIFKHKELESQLYEAKLQQSNLALQEEQERCKRERSILLKEAAEAQTKCDMLTKQETQLKAQLAVYTEKFEEFQTTLTKSNEIFQTFKQEMDQMTKKIKKLEKETNMWRVRWENSNKSLLNMAEERTLREKELASQKTKVMRLEKLCRALQAERNALTGKAKTKEGKDASPSKKKMIEAVDTNASAASISDSKTSPTDSPETNLKGSEPAVVDSSLLVNGDCNHGDRGHGEDAGGTGTNDTTEKGSDIEVTHSETSVTQAEAGLKGEEQAKGEVACGSKAVVTSEIDREDGDIEAKEKFDTEEKIPEETGGSLAGDGGEDECVGVTKIPSDVTQQTSSTSEVTSLTVTDEVREKDSHVEEEEKGKLVGNSKDRDDDALAAD